MGFGVTGIIGPKSEEGEKCAGLMPVFWNIQTPKS
jgi:hypothetical protein